MCARWIAKALLANLVTTPRSVGPTCMFFSLARTPSLAGSCARKPFLASLVLSCLSLFLEKSHTLVPHSLWRFCVVSFSLSVCDTLLRSRLWVLVSLLRMFWVSLDPPKRGRSSLDACQGRVGGAHWWNPGCIWVHAHLRHWWWQVCQLACDSFLDFCLSCQQVKFQHCQRRDRLVKDAPASITVTQEPSDKLRHTSSLVPLITLLTRTNWRIHPNALVRWITCLNPGLG